MLHDPAILNPVQVAVGARLAPMRLLRGEEDEVPLPEQELDLVDGPVAPEHFQVAQELANAVGDAGLVVDAAITGEVP